MPTGPLRCCSFTSDFGEATAPIVFKRARDAVVDLLDRIRVRDRDICPVVSQPMPMRGIIFASVVNKVRASARSRIGVPPRCTIELQLIASDACSM